MKAQSSGLAAPSFASVVAAAPQKTVAPLSRTALEKMTHLQAINAFNARFSGNYSLADITKEGIISAYLSRVAPPPRPRNQPGKIPLHTSEWTVVRSSTLPDAGAPRGDAATIIRRIRQDIAGVTAPNTVPEIQLLSGRWSSQISPNFILIFADKPDAKLVMKYRHHLLRPFGAGCCLAPRTGYTRVMTNRIRTMRTADGFDGALPTHATLVEELACNPMWNGIQLLGDIRWVNPMVAISKL